MNDDYYSIHVSGLHYMMTSRAARYSSAQAPLKLILEASDDSGSDTDLDLSDVDVDHLSEPSDHSDIELVADSIATHELHHPVDQDRGVAQADNSGALLANTPGTGNGRGRGRGHGRRRGRAQGRGRGQAQTPQGCTQQPQNEPANTINQSQNVMKGRNGTVWHKHAPDFGRRGPEDIMRQQPGVTHQAQCNTIGQAFSLFITPEMIDLLVLETNREARRKITDWNNDNPENQKQPWIRLDSTEMKAFIGLFLLAGVYKSNHEPVKSL